jgi:hypothetical protein
MLEKFRKYNYFTSKYASGQFGCLRNILNFMDDDGYNFFLLLNVKDYYRSPFNGFDYYKVEFNGIKDLRYILEDKSNFFRVDIIVLDLMEMELGEILNHKRELETIGGDYKFFIMCGDIDKMNIDGETKVFDIKTSLVGDYTKLQIKTAYEITDVGSGSKFTLYNMFESYKRKLKIDKILKKRNSDNI